MPVYEYFCKHCDGIFESMGAIAKAKEPAPCPLCSRKAERIPPTSFSPFTMREGYPRAIPDRGTYYHLGKEVKKPITGPTRMNEHPEINKPRPKPKKSKGELDIIAEKKRLKAREAEERRKAGMAQIIDRTARDDD